AGLVPVGRPGPRAVPRLGADAPRRPGERRARRVPAAARPGPPSQDPGAGRRHAHDHGRDRSGGGARGGRLVPARRGLRDRGRRRLPGDRLCGREGHARDRSGPRGHGVPRERGPHRRVGEPRLPPPHGGRRARGTGPGARVCAVRPSADRAARRHGVSAAARSLGAVLALAAATGCKGERAHAVGPAPAPLVDRSAWQPPAGIPAPEFGVRERPGGVTHWVDNTNRQATDERNPYGSPSRPRLTVPASLAAGSVVEVRGGPYTMDTPGAQDTWVLAGEPARPVFVRGVG